MAIAGPAGPKTKTGLIVEAIEQCLPGPRENFGYRQNRPEVPDGGTVRLQPEIPLELYEKMREVKDERKDADLPFAHKHSVAQEAIARYLYKNRFEFGLDDTSATGYSERNAPETSEFQQIKLELSPTSSLFELMKQGTATLEGKQTIPRLVTKAVMENLPNPSDDFKYNQQANKGNEEKIGLRIDIAISLNKRILAVSNKRNSLGLDYYDLKRVAIEAVARHLYENGRKFGLDDLGPTGYTTPLLDESTSISDAGL